MKKKDIDFIHQRQLERYIKQHKKFKDALSYLKEIKTYNFYDEEDLETITDILIMVVERILE